MTFHSFCDISIGFPSEEYASIVKQVLEVDPELSPEKVDRTYEVSGQTLNVHFKAVDAKSLRLSISTFFDMVQVAIKAISEFGTY